MRKRERQSAGNQAYHRKCITLLMAESSGTGASHALHLFQLSFKLGSQKADERDLKLIYMFSETEKGLKIA
jgi:hypothetical protein